jgi:hypothetical protein
LDEPCRRLSPSQQTDIDYHDNRACSFLAFGRGGSGLEEFIGVTAIMVFSNGGICDAHQAHRFAVAPAASPSSSLLMVEALATIFLKCSAVASHHFFMSFSTSF